MRLRQRLLHLAAGLSVLAALSAGPGVAGAQPSAGARAAPSAPTTAFVVNSLADAPDADLSNPACATAGAVCTWRAAVQQANASAGPDTITFSVTGIITLTATTPTITDTVSIVGPGAALLTLDANLIGPALQVTSNDPAVTIAISGLTLTGGRNPSGGGGVAFDGSATLVISGTVITGNLAMIGGGLNLEGVTFLINSTVSHNTASVRGGGIDNSGDLDITNSRIQENRQDLDADPTLLSVQGVGAYSGGGLFTDGPVTLTHSLVLSNTVEAPSFVQASAQPAAPSGPFGAGLYVYSTVAVISTSVIAGNQGLGCVTCPVTAQLGANPAGAPLSPLFGFGGGIYAYDSGVYIEDSQVLSNSAEVGGGLYVNSASVTLYRSLVADNRAHTGGGFGAYNPFLAVNDSVVRHNWAVTGSGGALYGTEGNIQFNNTLVRHNQAGGHGGGLYVGNADLYIGFSQIEGNASGTPLPVANAAVAEPQITSDSGGGLYLYGSDTQIYNSAILSNTATLGGGINNASELYIDNTTISGNSADRDGGGLRLTVPPVAVAGGGGLPTTELLHVTLAGNQADADDNGSGDGGGLYVSVATTITLNSTLLGLNLEDGGQASDCAGTGSIQSTGYNLIESTAGCAIAQTTGDQFGVVSGVLPLRANGGPTLTNALPLGSLALDTADPDFNKCSPQDQRNFPRPMGAGCDVGAFEWQALLFLPLVLR